MIDLTTEVGGRDGRFPPTRWSLIREAAEPAAPDCRASLEHLAGLYWRPVYAYLRRKWNKSNEEAKDLTQEFFAALCEKEFLGRLSPDRGRFRSYVMAALDNFVRLQYRSETSRKRGSGALRISLDTEEGFEPSAGESPERIFLREWARSIVADAAGELGREYRAAGKDKAYQLILRHDLTPSGEKVSYESMAQSLGMSVADVTVTLYRARQRLRELVLDRVRDTVTTSEEAEAELRELFGR